jgi:hypothetical protein
MIFTLMNTMILMVVSRDNPGLYEYATREFAGSSEITVVLDRRTTDRRGGRADSAGLDIERRRADRRRYAVDHRLRTIGWAFVRDGVVVRSPLVDVLPTSA